MSQFLMPSLGADMEAGTLVEQSIAPGNSFRRGDIIGAVETQKGVIEIEVFEDGTLDRWLVDIGTKVPVGMPLAVLQTDGAQDPSPQEIPIPPMPQPDPAPPQPVPIPTEIPQQPDPAPVPQPPEQPPPETSVLSRTRRVTPAARKLAAERGIDLADLPRTDRIIRRRDIPNTAPVVLEPADPAAEMRSAIAAAMTRSKQQIPHYYLSHQIDLTAADAFLTAHNAERAPQDRLVLGALSIRAVASALAKFPEFNGHYINGRFLPSASVHLGVAIHLRSGGLVAPALFDADKRNPTEVMADLQDLVTRVRAGRFRARELSDATITVTSLGERGVDQVIGVIYPPQVAIVGIGTPRQLPMVCDGRIVSRLSTTLTLAADHRVSDGHRGALFLKAIDAHLQEPDTL